MELTKKELSQLYYLRREIAQEQRRLKELEKATETGSGKITGLPIMQGMAAPAELVAQIADSRAVISAKLELAGVEYNRLCRYITGVDDSLMRQILTQRFIEGKSWRQVARAIGGGNTEDSVKKAFYRYLKSCPDCPEQA